MIKYTIKRILAGIPTVIVVSVLIFFLIHLIPGNPAEVMLGSEATPEAVADLTAKMGLDKPLLVQFGIWVKDCLHGDLGDSIFYNDKVTSVLASKMEPTIIMIIYSMVIALLIGIPIGVISAIKRNKMIDTVCMAISMLGISVPGFLLALVLAMLLSVQLGWFPTLGYKSIAEVGFMKSVFYYLTLPSLALGLQRAASMARVTRSSMLDVLGSDYIKTARAKGLKEHIVIIRHALKNAMGPILTQIGFSVAALAAGAVVIETIFTIPGMGQIAYNALIRRDYPLIQGYILLIAITYVLINTVVDILYKLFDPRVDIGA